MKPLRIIAISGALIFSGCTTFNNKYDGFETEHDACYSYIYGYNGVTKNYEKAYKWCSLGDKRGISSSTTLLAEIYFLGHGVDKDILKALELYMKAADQGHEHALFMVYYTLNKKLSNESSEEQKKVGIFCLEKAAKFGYKKAIDEMKKIKGDK